MQKTAIGSRLSMAGRFMVGYSDQPKKRRFRFSRTVTKMVLVVKLTILLLTAGLITAHATGTAQNICLSGRDLTLEQVFAAIELQTGYVLFNKGYLKDTKAVSLAFSRISLTDLLDKVLKGQSLEYTIRGKTIALSRKEAVSPMEEMISVPEPPQPITGRVMDSLGKPIAGASIKLIPGNRGASSDAGGSFIIDLVPAGNYTLEISFINYVTYRIKCTVSSNTPLALGNVVLRATPSALDEVQIIGYGTTTRRLNTGNVTSVKSADIEKQPVSNPLEALHGRVPGMVLDMQGGLPGDQIDIQIRGQNSIGAGNRPLYIVDGIPFDARNPSQQGRGASMASGVGAIGAQYNPLNTINPSDIESIEVLKDADATAIYGSRAANGVILITTKKGKSGKSSLSANIYTGLGKVVNTIPVLSTQEYLKLRQQAFTNDNVTPNATNAPDLVLWDQNAFTDFQEMMIGNRSSLTEASLRLSGGNEKTKFLMSGTYRRETPVYPKETNSLYKRGSFLFNVDHTAFNDKFNALFSAYYSTDRSNLPNQDLGLNYNLPPNYPLYKSQGSDTLYWNGTLVNPLSQFLRKYNTKVQNMVLTGALSYKILPSLKFKTNVGLNKLNFDQESITPASSLNPTGATTPQSSMTSALNVNETINIEPQLEFNAGMGSGKLNLIVGGAWQKTTSTLVHYINATGYASEDLITNLSSAGTINSLSNGFSQYNYASLFGRANYNWKAKYILNLTFRRDGSSRFGPDNRFGNFGAVGAAWIFSGEAFARHIPALSFGKLRGSYGTVGNDQIPDYGFLDSYASYNYTYGSVRGLYPARIPNPEYGWEVTKKLEVGLELGFLQNRILLNLAAYQNRSNSMLVGIPFAAQTGFTTMQANLPALIQNTGVEVELTTINIKKKDFSWKSAFNISFQKNELLKYPGFENSNYTNTYVVGQSVNIITAYEYAGVKNGIHSVTDKNGDGQISTGLFANGRGDFIVAGITTPPYFGGLDNSFQFKQWQLDLFFQFVKRVDYYQPPTQPPGTLVNYNKNHVLPDIQPTTTSGTAAYTAFSRYRQSDAVVVDASFIRLKNLALSYSINPLFLRKLNLQNCRIYLQGQNLITITDYIGIDPESRGTGMPPIKMITFGVQVSF